MTKLGFPNSLIRLIKSLYSAQESCIRVNNQDTTMQTLLSLQSGIHLQILISLSTAQSTDPTSSLPPPIHTIGDKFPRSQHRSTIILHPALVNPTPSLPLPRWNLRKADWVTYRTETRQLNNLLPNPANPDIDMSYSAFCSLITKIAKNSIPRGFRKRYIPGWDKTCNELYEEHQQSTTETNRNQSATQLLEYLDLQRQKKRIETVEEINFTHSSRKAWATINRLTGNNKRHTSKAALHPNKIASCLVNNGKYKSYDRDRKINNELKQAWHSPSADSDLCSDFTVTEVKSAIKSLKKANLPDLTISILNSTCTSLALLSHGLPLSTPPALNLGKYQKSRKLRK